MAKIFNNNIPKYWDKKDVEDIKKARNLNDIIIVAKRILNRTQQMQNVVFDSGPFLKAIQDGVLIKKEYQVETAEQKITRQKHESDKIAEMVAAFKTKMADFIPANKYR